jgi:hypothetical protein
MPIQYRCSCGREYNLGDEYAGKSVKCPACGATGAVAAGVAPMPPPTPVGYAPPVPPGPYSPPVGAGLPVQGTTRYDGKAKTSLTLGIISISCSALILIVSAAMGASRRPTEASAKATGILAIVLLVAGAVAGIIAIVLGAMSMKPDNRRTRGIAIAGLVTGIVGTVLVGSCLLMVFAVLMAAFRHF